MRRLWVMFAVAAGVSCGGSPTAPAALPPLRDGRFDIRFGGDTIACGDLKTPQTGTTVNVNVVGTHEGETWIGRPATPDDGVFEIRLNRTASPPGTSPFDIAVAGSISGTAQTNIIPDVPFIQTKDGSVAIFPSGTPISGRVLPPFTVSQGDVTAAVTFTRAGVTSTCPAGAVGWLMNGPR